MPAPPNAAIAPGQVPCLDGRIGNLHKEQHDDESRASKKLARSTAGAGQTSADRKPMRNNTAVAATIASICRRCLVCDEKLMDNANKPASIANRGTSADPACHHVEGKL